MEVARLCKLVVLIVAVMLIAAACGGGDDAAGEKPEATARRFLEARDSWDAQATERLLASDAVIRDLEVPRAADYAQQYRWYATLDWRWRVDECTEMTSGPPAEVACTYTMENAWSRAMGAGPFEGTYEFVVSDGQIQEVNGSDGFNVVEFSPVWGSFKGWVSANHLDDVAVMYVGATPVYTPESMALWEQHTEAFVASLAEAASS